MPASEANRTSNPATCFDRCAPRKVTNDKVQLDGLAHYVLITGANCRILT